MCLASGGKTKGDNSPKTRRSVCRLGKTRASLTPSLEVKTGNICLQADLTTGSEVVSANTDDFNAQPLSRSGTRHRLSYGVKFKRCACVSE